MKKREHSYQIYDGVWYKLQHGKPPYYHECCGCGLVHRTDYKLDRGTIYYQWTVDPAQTRKARALRAKTKADE
jgi:folate-dependent phosphoribosylglycinamide formyltransferase PurN